MGIGSITFSLPHFLTGPHHVAHGVNATTNNICRSPRLLDQADRDNILKNLPGLENIKSLAEGDYHPFFTIDDIDLYIVGIDSCKKSLM